MIQLGESNERIWESIGLVQSTFSDTNELVDLVDHIQKNNKIVGEDIENEVIKSFDFFRNRVMADAGKIVTKIRTNHERDEFCLQRINEVDFLLGMNFEVVKDATKVLELQIDRLLNYLRTEIKKSSGSVPN